MGSPDGKFLVNLLVNLYGVTLGLDVVTELGSLDGSNDGLLEVLLLRGSLGYTDGKFLGFGEGIKLENIYGEVIGTILVNVDGIALGVDFGTELGSLYGSFDGSNDGKL